MQSKEMVSIIIPVYNVEKYIVECLESVVNQTYENLEIILVNDGSTDNSKEICLEYAQRDQRIKLYSKENGGLSSARNYGLSKVTGNYVFFLDSDDYLVTDTIENLLNMLINTNADVSSVRLATTTCELEIGIVSNYEIVNAEKALEFIFTEKKMTTSVSGKLYKVKLWDKILFPTGKIFEDYATLYKVINKCQVITLSQKSKYYYRPNDTGITGASFTERKLDYFDVTEDVIHFVSDNYPELLKFVDMRTTRYAISIFKDMSRCNYYNDEVIRIIRKIVKDNILEYIMTDYKTSSKMYGLLIVVFPKFAMSLFRRRYE